MSILIKGMEMPENCALCKFRGVGETWCPFTWQEVPGNTIPEDCPLVPVPPHGRLIDADAFEEFIRKDWDKDDHWIAEVVYSRPTIIPAEEAT